MCVCVLVMWKLKGGRSSSGLMRIGRQIMDVAFGFSTPVVGGSSSPQAADGLAQRSVLSMAQDVASDIAKDRKTFWA